MTTGTFLTNDLSLLCDRRRVLCGEDLYPISPVLSAPNLSSHHLTGAFTAAERSSPGEMVVVVMTK